MANGETELSGPAEQMLDDHAASGAVDLGEIAEQGVRLLQAVLGAQLVLQHIDNQLDLFS